MLSGRRTTLVNGETIIDSGMNIFSLLLDNLIWLAGLCFKLSANFQSSYGIHFLLLSLLVTCCRDGYWNIRASVHASVIQIFPPGASHQTAMHQNLTEPVSRPRIIALLLLLIVTSQCSAGSRGPPWRWSSSTASLWACTNPARTQAFATKSAKCWRFVMLLHRCFIIFDALFNAHI